MVNTLSTISFNLTHGYYRYIGSGSSRKVFDLGNGYVVKVAMNMAGIAQNKTEYMISFNNSSGLFAKVMKVSKDFRLLIMKKARKIRDIWDLCRYFNVSSTTELVCSKELQHISGKYNLLLGDLKRIDNWGIIDGDPVIIDYGFTREVRSRYY